MQGLIPFPVCFRIGLPDLAMDNYESLEMKVFTSQWLSVFREQTFSDLTDLPPFGIRVIPVSTLVRLWQLTAAGVGDCCYGNPNVDGKASLHGAQEGV